MIPEIPVQQCAAGSLAGFCDPRRERVGTPRGSDRDERRGVPCDRRRRERDLADTVRRAIARRRWAAQKFLTMRESHPDILALDFTGTGEVE